ncbi:metal-dependent phosphohydrolase [Armatimonadota bacterium]|nr:metal-dependent phosphohydrolase [Armatimonadota bacterium]
MKDESPIFAAIDIGTNSIRLAVVRSEASQGFTTLAQHREVVRLGEGEFDTNQMTPDAIKRGALVCAKFAEVARGFGAKEIIAFATSATREADNRDEFVERVREEAEIEVRVISGVEEARLIWLGVSSGIDLAKRKAILMDIGGGSTEVIIGNKQEYLLLDSLKLGAIRLSSRFFTSAKAYTAEEFAQAQEYVRATASQLSRKVGQVGFDIGMGSAGTITTLGEITARRSLDSREGAGRQLSFTLKDLRTTVELLYKLPLEERRRVPGMDANRADIIVGGSAILLTLMEMFRIERLTVSERGLRDGILLDHTLREEEERQQYQEVGVRRRSILQLARACNYEGEHAAHTSFIALRLFEELKSLGEHNYGLAERELLDYAAITHDIGNFLSHSNHQKHAYYLIRNSDLLGFNDTEIDIVANVALYHRKGFPKKKHENLVNLNKGERRLVSVLAAILRVAEGVDRSHLLLVKDIRLERLSNPRRYLLTLFSDSDGQMEVWGVQNNRDLFEFIFDAPLQVQVVPLSEAKKSTS